MPQENKKVINLCDIVKEYFSRIGKNKQAQIIDYSKTQSNERFFIAKPFNQDQK